MFFQKLIAFFTALMISFSGVASVVGSSNVEPIPATERTYRFDQDKLLFGAYCFHKHDNYGTLREWFKEAGLNFAVSTWGQQLTEDDLNWLDENGIGIFAPNNAYYRGIKRDCIWGVDYRDEPASADFESLAEGVRELYAEDANRFPLINLFPMYASSEQLGEQSDIPGAFGNNLLDAFNSNSIEYRKHVCNYVGTIDSDIISVDIYPLHVDKETGELTTYEYWLRNLDILAEACRKTDRDLWVVTQAAGNTKEEDGGMRHCDTPEDQRWQNYVSLAFGAKAIIYACYYQGWWDQDSHMIDNSGQRTDTYYAVQQVNREMSVFADLYGKYENHGAVVYNRLNPDCAGAKLGLVRVAQKYKPHVLTSAPILCGCFTQKDGDGSAYVFTNMYEPQTGKSATFTATFPHAKQITVYRKGQATQVSGSSVRLTLENREGVFVTVS